MKKTTLLAIFIAVTMILFSAAGTVFAESDFAVNSDASVDLNFAVQIPQILYLRVGSLGATVDTVTFSVTDTPENQPEVTSADTPAIEVGALIATSTDIELIADSSADMVGAATSAAMPFTTVSYEANGDFSSMTKTPFSGTNSQVVWTSTGPGFRSGTLTYHFANSYTYEPDTYNGTVVYTLATP